MKRTILLFAYALIAIALIANSLTPAASLPAYYASVQGTSGKSLFDAVHVVAKVGYSTQFTYGNVWTAFQKTDLRDNGYIWDIYSDCQFEYNTDQDSGSGSSSECTVYNREHSIPKSWFGGSTSSNTPGTDIFHIYPTSKNVNSLRSNHPYGEVKTSSNTTGNGSQYGTALDIYVDVATIAGNNLVGTINQQVFEPVDEYKGDLARSYMGTMIKWAGDYQADFTSSDGATIFSGNYTAAGYFGLTSYGVALLMKWHRQDPVSQKEIDRNNGIQQTQGNRNPFIDYPYLAEYIWGERAGQTVDLANLITTYDERFILGESTGYLEGANIEQYTITWMVNGEPYTAGDPTTILAKGETISALPVAPTSCDAISRQFVGWSEYEIDATTNIAPADLFMTAADAPKVEQNTTFYAVFAHKKDNLSPAGDPMTYILTMTDTVGWTLSGVGKDTKNWKLLTNAYIELQQSIDASQISSIMITMRTYGGATYNTIEFKIGDTPLGQLVAANSQLNQYLWLPTTTIDAVGQLRFTSPRSTYFYGPALSAIEVNMNAPYVYLRYITTCTDATDVPHVPQSLPQTDKVIINGQLFILYNGLYYNMLGQKINQ